MCCHTCYNLTNCNSQTFSSRGVCIVTSVKSFWPHSPSSEWISLKYIGDFYGNMAIKVWLKSDTNIDYFVVNKVYVSSFRLWQLYRVCNSVICWGYSHVPSMDTSFSHLGFCGTSLNLQRRRTFNFLRSSRTEEFKFPTSSAPSSIRGIDLRFLTCRWIPYVV